jgi:hypothetical protein
LINACADSLQIKPTGNWTVAQDPNGPNAWWLLQTLVVTHCSAGSCLCLETGMPLPAGTLCKMSAAFPCNMASGCAAFSWDVKLWLAETSRWNCSMAQDADPSNFNVITLYVLSLQFWCPHILFKLLLLAASSHIQRV